TNQATPYQVSQDFCKESVKGHRFNPYLHKKTYAINQQTNQTNQTNQINENEQPPIVLGSNKS
ncbi:MAG: hypothetical protein Q8N29_02275, partial [Methylobacter sp.]|nr:hypothetical protein [Methylobacter sp.]MDP2430273.1 hypothetical protein [Methylobacter sp.]MDP3053451.1 hypothetical protein [Methylobacter sp.]